jgi:hypothetical protein
LTPDDCISGDQIKSSLLVLYLEPQSNKCLAGALFIDHSTQFLYFTPHQSTRSQEAISAQNAFELHALHYNQSIKCHHTNNGILAQKISELAVPNKNSAQNSVVLTPTTNMASPSAISSPSLKKLLPYSMQNSLSLSSFQNTYGLLPFNC